MGNARCQCGKMLNTKSRWEKRKRFPPFLSFLCKNLHPTILKIIMRLRLNVFYKKPPLLGRSQMLARLCRALQMRVGICFIYRLRLEPPPENLSFAMLNLIFYPPPWRGYEQDLFIFQLRFDNTRNLFLLIFQHYTDFFRQKLQDFLEVFLFYQNQVF